MNKENLIFEALAYNDKATPSPSLGVAKVKEGEVFEIYIKNAIISLVSAKIHNPDASVGLVINIDLDERWQKILVSNDILIWKCPFETFKMPDGLVYSLSYYKLCAFDYILKKTEYKRLCFIDCDTISVKNYHDLWVECDDAFMIVPNEEPYYGKVRQEINLLYNQIYNEDKKTITHYASGFIIGNREQVTNVLQLCTKAYKKVIDLPDLSAKGGDEIIWSLALHMYDKRIVSPKVYALLSFASATSYWIDKQDYTDENVVMWHLPADKRYSMIWAYNWFMKHRELPPMEKMARASRMKHVKTRITWLSIIAILQDKHVVSRNLAKLTKRF